MQRLFYIYGKHSPNFDKINEWAYYITGQYSFDKIASPRSVPVSYPLSSLYYLHDVHSGIKAENELNNFTEIPFSHYSTKQ
jgi:hypothetical protein